MDRHDRKQRLHQLLDLARVSKQWSRAELGRALRRDATKIYSDSGNPKLDFLISLANVLEWPIGEVCDVVWGEHAKVDGESTDAATDFKRLDRQALKAHHDGQYEQMVDIACKQYRAAVTPDQKALACNREYGGWDGLGRHQKALESARRGLRHGPLTATRRVQLQGNLANAYYALWDLTPALGIAQMLVEWHNANPPKEPAEGKRGAFAQYVRGNTRRRLMAIEPENSLEHARLAKLDLQRSYDTYRRLARDLNDESLNGIANTCLGAILEIDVELGERDAADAIEELMIDLTQVVDLDNTTVGDMLESYGWRCIFGSNIALRHLSGRRLQQVMAVLTNKALEIAERLDNWSMRERVFTMQYTLHEAIADSTGLDFDYTVDDEDRRLIVGTMGRFPTFRATGWRILETAKVVVG